jgi:hypothetical protein
MNTCKHCGENVEVLDKFCKSCGAKNQEAEDKKLQEIVSDLEKSTPPGYIDMSEYNKPGFFNKRIGRKFYFFTSVLISVVFSLPILTKDQNMLIALSFVSVLGSIFWVITAIWRLNDVGIPKLAAVFLFFPIVGFFFSLALLFQKGKLHKALGEMKK